MTAVELDIEMPKCCDECPLFDDNYDAGAR